MFLVVFNYVGIGIVAAGFGIAFLVGKVLGLTNEGDLMVIGGPLIALTDLVYRWKRVDGNFWHPDKGGMLLFLPIWVLGVLWTFLGAYYVLFAAGAPQVAN